MTGVRAFGPGAVDADDRSLKEYQLGPTSISEMLAQSDFRTFGPGLSCQAKTLCKGQKSIR
jgi:hypothetical protein